MIVSFKPSKVAIETTGKWSKKLGYQIRGKTGADVVINGTLFNYSTWKPVCPTKQNGVVLCESKYTYAGIAWNKGDGQLKVALSTEMDKYDNYISCVMLMRNGKEIPYYVDAAVARSAERTAIVGHTDGTVSLIADKTPRNIPALVKYIKTLNNIEWAMMLDGGGSTQLSQAGIHYVYSSRKVQNYLCFWKQDTEPKGEKPLICINAYSKKKDGSKKLSSNFSVKEFACNDGTDTVFVAPQLVMVLQSIRSHFGKAVNINSGYRTPAYNKKVGGVEDSQHLFGTAADIAVKGVEPKKVAEFARQIMPDFGGVGIYDTFTHVDVREVKADWKG